MMFPLNMVNILAVQEEEQREELRQFNIEMRIMGNESDPFQLGDNHFKELFRLTKDMAHYVLNRILPTISTKTCHIKEQWDKVIIYLCLNNLYQELMEVISAIVSVLGQEWIRFPTTVEEKNLLKARFMQSTRFPGAIAAIDCTYIAIIAPAVEEHNYLNHKGFHSKNVLIICDYDLKILNINARYGGATHDAYIRRNCIINQDVGTM
ncbi:hypothetical protein NQ314_010608, partial [Rhamnusium bicolor]